MGEKVRMDLQRKQSLPANKLATLMAKFDEVKTSGNMMPTATLAMGTMEGKDNIQKFKMYNLNSFVRLLNSLLPHSIFPKFFVYISEQFAAFLVCSKVTVTD